MVQFGLEALSRYFFALASFFMTWAVGVLAVLVSGRRGGCRPHDGYFTYLCSSITPGGRYDVGLLQGSDSNVCGRLYDASVHVYSASIMIPLQINRLLGIFGGPFVACI